MAALVGCTGSSPPRVEPELASVPALGDRGELCLDIADGRACWGGECGQRGCVVSRPEPSVLVPPSGFRCSGQRDRRVCEARAERAGPFACTPERCLQQRPRAPDNGEWDCVEIANVVYCRSIVAAAGIESGPRDPAFVCGPRRGQPTQSICVDLAPDPPPLPLPYVCRYKHTAGGGERLCEAKRALQVGMRCSGDCPAGATCVEGRCLPARPAPACWLDTDCARGERCTFGSCVVAP